MASSRLTSCLAWLLPADVTVAVAAADAALLSARAGLPGSVVPVICWSLRRVLIASWISPAMPGCRVSISRRSNSGTIVSSSRVIGLVLTFLGVQTSFREQVERHLRAADVQLVDATGTDAGRT